MLFLFIFFCKQHRHSSPVSRNLPQPDAIVATEPLDRVAKRLGPTLQTLSYSRGLGPGSEATGQKKFNYFFLYKTDLAQLQ